MAKTAKTIIAGIDRKLGSSEISLQLYFPIRSMYSSFSTLSLSMNSVNSMNSF